MFGMIAQSWMSADRPYYTTAMETPEGTVVGHAPVYQTGGGLEYAGNIPKIAMPRTIDPASGKPRLVPRSTRELRRRLGINPDAPTAAITVKNSGVAGVAASQTEQSVNAEAPASLLSSSVQIAGFDVPIVVLGGAAVALFLMMKK